MTTSHTPGPWIVECDSVVMANQTVVLSPAPDGAPRDVIKANARLIAAAPELLAALQASNRLMCEALPKFNWGSSTLDANAIKLINEVPRLVRAAIAKATS